MRSYPTLKLADVYTIIGRYLADPAPFENYLRLCNGETASIRRDIEASQKPVIGRDALIARARAQGLVP